MSHGSLDFEMVEAGSKNTFFFRFGVRPPGYRCSIVAVVDQLIARIRSPRNIVLFRKSFLERRMTIGFFCFKNMKNLEMTFNCVYVCVYA